MRFLSYLTTSPTIRIRLCALLAGALLAEAIALGASLFAGVRLQAPAGTIAAEPADISALSLAVASLVLPLIGWALLTGLERLTASYARRVWLVLALAALGASWIAGPLSGNGVSAIDRVVLCIIHLGVAATVVPVLYLTATTTAAAPGPRTWLLWRHTDY